MPERQIVRHVGARPRAATATATCLGVLRRGSDVRCSWLRRRHQFPSRINNNDDIACQCVDAAPASTHTFLPSGFWTTILPMCRPASTDDLQTTDDPPTSLSFYTDPDRYQAQGLSYHTRTVSSINVFRVPDDVNQGARRINQQRRHRCRHVRYAEHHMRTTQWLSAQLEGRYTVSRRARPRRSHGFCPDVNNRLTIVGDYIDAVRQRSAASSRRCRASANRRKSSSAIYSDARSGLPTGPTQDDRRDAVKTRSRRPSSECRGLPPDCCDKRTQSGEVGRFQPGIGMIASRLEVPVVPVRLEGLDRILHQSARFPTVGRGRCAFGAPLSCRGTTTQRWRRASKLPSERCKLRRRVVSPRRQMSMQFAKSAEIWHNL